MPSFCVVLNCENKYTHSDNISFHKFPHHSKPILKKWVQFTERGSNWKPSRWSAICSRHFLPSDFRDSTTRKCLKKDAIPSMTVKNIDGKLLDFHTKKQDELNTQDDGIKVNCRLCGLCSKSAATFITNFEVFGMIQKCFPTLNIQQDDKLPKDLCSDCLERLQTFSDFVDNVLRTQKNLEEKFNKIQSIQPLSTEKPLKIKQEPAAVKVKQEECEGFQDFIDDVLCGGIDDEQDLEQKSNLSEFPYFNPQEIINNCDIMEIINLDDAFIDIPDDEAVNEEQPLEPKFSAVTQELINPFEEHNYSKINEDEITETVRNYKVEKPEEQDFLQPEPIKPYRDIIVLNESIVKPIPSYDQFQCDYCSRYFLTEGLLAQHKRYDHAIRDNVCAICNSQFQTISDLLRHKNTVHRKVIKYTKSKSFFQSCIKCGKTFITKLALNNHQKYICEFPQSRTYECKYCSKQLTKWILLRKHERNCDMRPNNRRPYKKHTEDKNTLVTRTISNEKQIFICDICGRTYNKRQIMMRHRN